MNAAMIREAARLCMDVADMDVVRLTQLGAPGAVFTIGQVFDGGKRRPQPIERWTHAHAREYFLQLFRFWGGE